MNKFLLDLKNEGQAESLNSSLKDFFKRLKGVVVSPGETMKKLNLKPNLLFPILLIIVVVIGTLLINTGPYKEYTKGELIKSNITQKVNMSTEKVNETVDKSSYLRLIVIPLLTLLMWVIGTAVLYLLIRVLKGKGSFIEFLTITGYAYLIIIFSGILQSIVVLITGNYVQEFSISSLGFFLPRTLKGNFFYGMAGGIEFFKIWNYYVIGLGICYISKLSRTKVYTALGVRPLILGGISEVLVTMVK